MGEVTVFVPLRVRSVPNPPRTKDRFEEDLKAYFAAQGLDFGMSALGGMVACRGHVSGKGRSVTEFDRHALAEWAKAQRVRCTARLGALEIDHDDLQFFREVTECVFEIDNLTPEDRAEAAAFHEETRRWVESVQKRQV